MASLGYRSSLENGLTSGNQSSLWEIRPVVCSRSHVEEASLDVGLFSEGGAKKSMIVGGGDILAFG